MVFRRLFGQPEPETKLEAGQPAPAPDAPPVPGVTSETETVRKIAGQLQALPLEQRKYIAGFAYVLGRAAHGDLQVSEDEAALIERTVVEVGGLSEPQAVLVVEIARNQGELYGATEDYLVTREFARDATFGYRASSLPEWVEEKTGGRVRADQVRSVSIDADRRGASAGQISGDVPRPAAHVADRATPADQLDQAVQQRSVDRLAGQLTADLGQLNTYRSVIAIYTGLLLPFSTFLLVSFFRTVPRELLESARIDGASHVRRLWSIVLPVSLPALATVATVQALWVWNEVLIAVVFLQSEDLRSLMVGVTIFRSRYHLDIPLVMAGMVWATIPMVVLYLLLQRFFIRGLTAGAVKG